MKTLFWRFLVIIFITLGIIGAILPGMPTTVFLILAAWAASKGWPQMDAWLLNHPKYGPTLKNWRENGTVPRKAKWLASGMMLVSGIIMIFTNAPLWVKIFTNTIMLLVSIWLWLRPESKIKNQKSKIKIMVYRLHDADILIDLPQQQLILPKLDYTFQISSALNGIGEAENSGQTPRGWHCIDQKIGHDACLNSVFIGRQFTGEIYNEELAQQYPDRDWILSRILWLKGLEPGLNLGEGHDTWQRYIYIHGTPDINPMGIPLSHGCIRMHNLDVIKLFDLVNEKALVFISEQPIKELF